MDFEEAEGSSSAGESPVQAAGGWRPRLRYALETVVALQVRVAMGAIYLIVLGPVKLLMVLLGFDPMAGDPLEPGSDYSAPRRRPPMDEHLRNTF